MPYVQSGYWVVGYAVGDSSPVQMQCDLTTVKSGIQSLNDNMQLMYDDLVSRIQPLNKIGETHNDLHAMYADLRNMIIELDLDVDLSSLENLLNQLNSKVDNIDFHSPISNLEDELKKQINNVILSMSISRTHQSLNGLSGSLKDGTKVNIKDSAISYIVDSSFILTDINTSHLCYRLVSNDGHSIVVTHNQIVSPLLNNVVQLPNLFDGNSSGSSSGGSSSGGSSSGDSSSGDSSSGDSGSSDPGDGVDSEQIDLTEWDFTISFAISPSYANGGWFQTTIEDGFVVGTNTITPKSEVIIFKNIETFTYENGRFVDRFGRPAITINKVTDRYYELSILADFRAFQPNGYATQFIMTKV